MAAGAVEANITTNNSKAGAFFDGTDDQIWSTPCHAEILTTNPCSFSLWFKTTDATEVCNLLTHALDPSNRFGFSISSENIRFGVYNGAAYVGKSSGAFTNGEWTHIVGIWTGAASKLYINGVLQVGTTQPALSANVYLFGAGAAGRLEGMLSQVKIYNMELDQTQVNRIYAGEKITTGLLANYPLQKDFEDTIGNQMVTVVGSILQIQDQDISAAIKADRVTANDTFLMTGIVGGQMVTTAIEEAP